MAEYSVAKKAYGNAALPPETGLASADKIFAQEGQATFLMRLSLAAYHLDARETTGAGINSDADTAAADAAYTDLQENLDWLDSADIAIDNTAETMFGRNGLENGIFTNLNAAALVGRAEDALFVAFRGTNDFNLWEPDLTSPDMDHWTDKDDHFALFTELFEGLADYAADNGISQVFMTGHSLGASMVEATLLTPEIRTLFGEAEIHGVNFASPGYGNVGDSSEWITTFNIKGDPVGRIGAWDNNSGDRNTIHHNVGFWDAGSLGVNLHDSKLHADVMAFFHTNRLDTDAFRSLNGIDYDDIFVNFGDGSLEKNAHGNYPIGAEADVIRGSDESDIILGGARNDMLWGKAGRDHIIGGGGSDVLRGGYGGDFLFGRSGKDMLVGGYGRDKLIGGKGADTLTGGLGKDLLAGGKGRDVFVFSTISQTNSANGMGKVDRIKDFDAHGAPDTIDLSGIDAVQDELGNQAFTFVGDITETGFSGTQGELGFFHRPGGKTFVTGDCDGDGNADFWIMLRGTHELDSDDFIL